MLPLALVFRVFLGSLAADDDVGFGGAPAVEKDDLDGDVDHAEATGAVDDAPTARPGDFVTGAASRTLAAFPEPKVEDVALVKTPLELELERARLDPAQHPLLALRVEVARARQAFEQGRKNGLYSLKEEEATLRDVEAILVDVERIALHRMNVCMTRQGKNVVVKNYRMTPAGPVRLSTPELLAQASPVDPDGCGRIFLIDDALVQRVRRAHALRRELSTRRFGFHDMAERRALEAEQAALQKELAKEDLPIISLPGALDPHQRRSLIE
jgi:hypothetical protein